MNAFNAICDKFEDSARDIWEYIQKYDSEEYPDGEYDVYLGLFHTYYEKGWIR